jgi:CDP-glucose 4,6-dehydratase
VGYQQCPLEIMVIEKNFWENKKVFVTGHTGFKGGWLCLWLQSLGAKVTGYSLEPGSSPNLFEIGRVADRMTSIIGDISNYHNLATALSDAKPEIVFHMAAQPLVRYSYDNPIETFTTNVIGTVHVFEAVRKCSTVKALVNVTTDKCYENKEWIWSYRENESMGGHDPYSCSKGCAELVTSSFRESFFSPEAYERHGLALASVRAGNVVGGGDWSEDRLVPDILRAVNANKSVNVRNPDSTRPWQHVLEPISGYLILAEKLFTHGMQYAEAWNFGPETGESISVLEILKKLDHLIPSGIKWTISRENNVHEAKLLTLDISKAKKYLKWKPLLDIDKTLQLIVDWNTRYNSGADMHDFTHQQIELYQDQLLDRFSER